MAEKIEQTLLQQVAAKGSIADTGDFAAEVNEDHLKVVGVMKSLEMAEMITVQVSVPALWAEHPGAVLQQLSVVCATPIRVATACTHTLVSQHSSKCFSAVNTC